MKLALITGGPGPEREGSLASANAVADVLTGDGIAHDYIDLCDIASVDMSQYQGAILMTHGRWGEDGRLQGYLDTLSIPYTGSPTLASAIAMHKPTTNLIASSVGMSVPASVVFTRDVSRSELAAAVERVGADAILRPADGGGSRGVLRSTNVDALMDHIAYHGVRFSEYLLCSFIAGTEVSAALIDDDGSVRGLPILATYHEGEFYDYHIKHDADQRRHECPADIPSRSSEIIVSQCSRLYTAIGLAGYARFDFIVDSSGTPWFLEVNTIPGMSRQGNLATMAAAAGISYDELVREHLVAAGLADGA